MTKVGSHEWAKGAKDWDDTCTLGYIADSTRDVTPILEHLKIH
jgi:hypothetical protein